MQLTYKHIDKSFECIKIHVFMVSLLSTSEAANSIWWSKQSYMHEEDLKWFFSMFNAFYMMNTNISKKWLWPINSSHKIRKKVPGRRVLLTISGSSIIRLLNSTSDIVGVSSDIKTVFATQDQGDLVTHFSLTL